MSLTTSKPRRMGSQGIAGVDSFEEMTVEEDRAEVEVEVETVCVLRLRRCVAVWPSLGRQAGSRARGEDIFDVTKRSRQESWSRRRARLDLAV